MKKLHFIPLGGSEEFGLNCNLYEYDNTRLMIDCGMGFADDYYPGIDLLLPDISYLKDKKLDGLVITHAHEDHIGAVPYLFNQLNCPIYTTPFTAEVLRRKLAETDYNNIEIIEIDYHTPYEIGSFIISGIPVAHSIPDAFACVVETPLGKIVHSGDWNLDPAPVAGHKTDTLHFKALGAAGVLAYIGDSTNSGVDGRSGSESDVEEGLTHLFKELEGQGRIVITIFSSNIGRIHSIARAAQANDRSVAVIGRSLINMSGAAKQCGYLDDIKAFVPEDNMGDIPNDKLVMIVTGSQGEPRAALARLARDDHRDISLSKGDTVIFSSRIIPGREREINFVQNRLSRLGVSTITARDTDHVIHVSGHPKRDEVIDMYDWLQPKIVVPVHGEHVHLAAQAEVAREHGVKQVVVPHNGSVIEITSDGAKEIERLPIIKQALDAADNIISSEHAAIAERRKLPYLGAIAVSLALTTDGQLCADPQITTWGLIDTNIPADCAKEDDLINCAVDAFDRLKAKDKKNFDLASEKIRIAVRKHALKIFNLRPKVSVHVLMCD